MTPARLCAPYLSLSLLLSFSVPRWFFSSFVAIHGWTSPTSLSFYAGSRHYARTAVCGNGWRDPRRGILKVLGWLPHFQNSSFRFRPKERFYSTVVAWDVKVLETISFCLARIIKNEGAADTSEFSFPRNDVEKNVNKNTDTKISSVYLIGSDYIMTWHYCFIELSFFWIIFLSMILSRDSYTEWQKLNIPIRRKFI